MAENVPVEILSRHHKNAERLRNQGNDLFRTGQFYDALVSNFNLGTYQMYLEMNLSF
jgi:hypothetical protein